MPARSPRRRLFGSRRIRSADARGAFRPPCDEAPTFVAAVEAMVRAERQPGYRTYLYTFTTACSGTRERLLRDVRRQFDLLQQSRPWRRLADAVWVVADDRREDPHVHVVALLPPNLTRAALRNAWKGGISNAERVTKTPARLGAYLGIQWEPSRGIPEVRRRKWGRKRHQGGGLACTPPDSSLPDPTHPEGSRMGAPVRPHVAPPVAPTGCERSKEELGQRHEPPLGAQRATPDLDGLVPSRGRRPGGSTMTRTVEGRGGGRVPPCGSEQVHPPDAHPDHDARHHVSDNKMTVGEHHVAVAGGDTISARSSGSVTSRPNSMPPFRRRLGTGDWDTAWLHDCL